VVLSYKMLRIYALLFYYHLIFIDVILWQLAILPMTNITGFHKNWKMSSSIFQTVGRGIAMEHTTDASIQLIKDHGRCVDPPAEE